MVEQLLYSQRASCSPMLCRAGGRCRGRRSPRATRATTTSSSRSSSFTALVMVAIHRSRLGRVLRGLSDSPVAVATMGLSTNMTRVHRVLHLGVLRRRSAASSTAASIHFATSSDTPLPVVQLADPAGHPGARSVRRAVVRGVRLDRGRHPGLPDRRERHRLAERHLRRLRRAVVAAGRHARRCRRRCATFLERFGVARAGPADGGRRRLTVAIAPHGRGRRLAAVAAGPRGPRPAVALRRPRRGRRPHLRGAARAASPG